MPCSSAGRATLRLCGQDVGAFARACNPDRTATAAGLGIVAGFIAIRRQGIYFAMITLALAQMMYFFALRAPFTGGEDGIQTVPVRRLFGMFDLSGQMSMYAFVLIIVLAAFLLIYRIINSPFGEVLKAIRENEQRAISLGYKTSATSWSPSCCRQRFRGSPAR